MFAWADECNADGGGAGAGIGGGVWGESKAATARGNADGGGDGRLCKKHREPCAVFKVKKEVSKNERNSTKVARGRVCVWFPEGE